VFWGERGEKSREEDKYLTVEKREEEKEMS
jgi:hypothetical protein